jgi:ferrous iron transport protein B
MVRAAVRHPRPGRISVTDRIDRIATHPRLGLLLLLAVLLVVFGTTFAVTIPLQAWLSTTVIQGLADAARTALAGFPDWVGGLIVDGIIAGAGTVLTLLPIIALFFVWMAALEESGYMARAAFVMDPLMHPLGLHGKSLLPLALGIGCNVPAVVGARIVEAPLPRLLTAMLTPFVPCAGRLAVVAFLAPIFFGAAAPFVAIGLIALNLVVLAAAGLVMKRIARPRKELPLIMELPLYQWPSARAVWRSAWDNTVSFLRRAGTVIVAVSAVLWVLGTYPGPDAEDTVLGIIGQALSPIGDLMGMSWQLIVALLAGIGARENIVAALGVVYAPESTEIGIAETLQAAVSPATGLAFLVVSMLFIPCASTLAAIFTETGRARWAALSAIAMLGVSLTAGIVVYHLAVLIGPPG